MKRRHAFSLIELLVVLAIVAVMAVLVTPPIASMMRGARLTQAVDQLNGILNFARHAAIANNHTVEVRFYQYGNSEFSGQQSNNPASGYYCAVQVFLYKETGNALALDQVERLPGNIIMDSGAYSSLLATTQKKTFTAGSALDPQMALPVSGTNYNTRSFQFRPDGATNLQVGAQWYVTLHDSSYKDPAPMLPPDFATIEIDPIGGTVTTFRR